MPVYDALYDYEGQIKHVLTRHEQGAVHAAQGYARISGKVGVCLATSGPGATNLITGLADAQIDSTPLVCITGQVAAHFAPIKPIIQFQTLLYCKQQLSLMKRHAPTYFLDRG